METRRDALCSVQGGGGDPWAHFPVGTYLSNFGNSEVLSKSKARSLKEALFAAGSDPIPRLMDDDCQKVIDIIILGKVSDSFRG